MGRTHTEMKYLALAPSFEHWGGSCHLSAQHSRRGRNRPAGGDERMSEAKRGYKDSDNTCKFKGAVGVFSAG